MANKPTKESGKLNVVIGKDRKAWLINQARRLKTTVTQLLKDTIDDAKGRN